MGIRKTPDPIPDDFDTYEAAADFWDRHDTTDYPDAFTTVKVDAELRERHYDLEIDPKLARLLRTQARRRRTTPSALANRILSRALARSR